MSFATSVDPKRLQLLSPKDAVDLLRELLWLEGARQGINLLDVNVPSNITAPDGGVDADVGPAPRDTGLLAQGWNSYQIKTGDFSASTNTDLKDLFYKEGKTELKDRVRSCFARGGTFHVVLFGTDNPEQTDENTIIITKCKEFLKKDHPELENLKIKVVRPNQIAGLLIRYVGLALRAQGITNAPFRVHQEWAGQQDMQLPIAYGAEQQELLERIRKELRRDDAAVHVSIAGEPGLGKTRLALEATRTDDLGPLVTYCQTPDDCRTGRLVEMLLHDEHRRAILIVDDCDLQDAQTLWNALGHQGARVKLVTLQHEIPKVNGSLIVIALPPLPDEQILAIIQQYVPGAPGRGFVPLCSGSPRVAHVIGGNLRRYPDDLLKSPDTVDVWGRYISGTDDPASELVRERHTILRYCALFKKFGRKQPVHEELKAIIALIGASHPEIGAGRVQTTIEQLRGRRILQGDATLYITPKALHVKLWGEWWETYGQLVELEKLVEGFPATLNRWFFDMFQYAQESAVAGKIVEELLGPNGPFVNTSLLESARGAEVFSVLADANTEAALRCLERTVGAQSVAHLQGATEGRRYLVWSLERIAVWRPYFTRAALLLQRLALAENEPSISNNATGVFCDLFSLAPGEVAPTEAPPEERLPLLAAMINDHDPAVRVLGLKACRKGLNYGHFFRSSGSDQRGLRIPPQRWKPATYGEWFTAYENLWGLLQQAYDKASGEEASRIADALIDHAYGLAQISRLSPFVLGSLAQIGKRNTNKRSLLDLVQLIVDNLEKIPTEHHTAWQELLKQLTGGDDFASRLQRFVSVSSWRFQSKHEQEFTGALEQLASDALKEPGVLYPQLPWLFSKEAENAHAFGYALGKQDAQHALWEPVRDAATSLEAIEYVGLLGGYLRAINERDETTWLALLDEASKTPKLQGALYELIFQSRLNDASAHLLTSVIKAGVTPALVLRRFTVGNMLRDLSAPVFRTWCELLDDGGPQEVQTKLELLDAYYQRGTDKTPVPVDDVMRVLTDERLFVAGERSGMLTDLAWQDLAAAVKHQAPERIAELVATIADHFGIESAVMHEHGASGPTKWLDEVSTSHPVIVWDVVKERIGPPIDRRAFQLMHWIQGNSFEDRTTNFLNEVPREALWAWVDADVEKRAWYLANLAPATLTDPSLAREILIRYGDRKDVRDNLMANFETEGWWGPQSEHVAGKRRNLQAVYDTEKDPKVRSWLAEYLDHLTRTIEHAKVREEREI